MTDSTHAVFIGGPIDGHERVLEGRPSIHRVAYRDSIGFVPLKERPATPSWFWPSTTKEARYEAANDYDSEGRWIYLWRKP